MLTIINSKLSSSSAFDLGGAIDNGGTLTINNSTLDSNSDEYGGALENDGTSTIINSVFSNNGGGTGSAIDNGYYGTGTLTVTNTLFLDNTGGDTIDVSGMVTLQGCRFDNTNLSSTGYDNDAIDNYAVLAVNSSTFTGFTAGRAIYTYEGQTTIDSSVFFNNQNGVSSYGGFDTINNSTLTGNIGGGGVDNDNGYLTISNSTIIGNTSTFYGGVGNFGEAQIINSIVAGNSLFSAMNGTGPDVNGAITSLGHNLIGDGTSTGLTNGSNGDQIGTSGAPIDPKLGPLAGNGGPTLTMALQAGSPAIGKGDCTGNSTVSPPAPAVTVDQRGVARTLPCNIGAYQGASTGHIDSIGVYFPGDGTFYLRLHNNGGSADFSAKFNPGTQLYSVVGDWTGAGFDSIGVYDRSIGRFYLRNTISAGTYDETLVFGNPNDTPLSGRWTTSAAHDGVGVYRPTNGILYVKNDLTTGYSDHALVLGNPGDQGIAGDWIGSGQDGLGVFRPGNLNFYLVNQVGDGIIYSNENFQFGGSTDLAIAGDWTGQGHDGVGVFRPSNATVYLKNALTTGASDISFLYGASGDLPIAGHWQVTYPPITTPPVVIARTPAPKPTSAANGGSVPGGNQIGG